MKNIILNNGVAIPEIGLGVFMSHSGDETKNAVEWALEAGYTHIDTARIYGNEASVADGVKASGVKRSDVFITTKLWNQDIRDQITVQACERSLKLLDTDYIDLYLIHWPVDKREIAWAEMEKLLAAGKLRGIGVSNFQRHHLEELEKTWNIIPAVNQIETNPYFSNQELIDYCLSRGIAVEAWSPLGGSRNNNILDDDTLSAIGAKYGKSVAQVIIRWHLQRGLIVLPKSVHKERIVQNIDVFDFELTAEDMAAINGLNRNTRVGADPDNFNF